MIGKPGGRAGMGVAAFARDLDQPRWLHELPNGDVLVAESNAPPKADGATGLPVDMLSGFPSPDGHAYGRPVGVALDKTGALLVADDIGNLVWRVSAMR